MLKRCLESHWDENCVYQMSCTVYGQGNDLVLGRGDPRGCMSMLKCRLNSARVAV